MFDNICLIFTINIKILKLTHEDIQQTRFKSKNKKRNQLARIVKKRKRKKIQIIQYTANLSIIGINSAVFLRKCTLFLKEI